MGDSYLQAYILRRQYRTTGRPHVYGHVIWQELGGVNLLVLYKRYVIGPHSIDVCSCLS